MQAGLLPGVAYVPAPQQRGTVVAQARQQGTTLPRGSHVQINVSRGKNPPPDRTVPGVVGKDRESARSSLVALGFEVQVRETPIGGGSPSGAVVEEAPQAGSRAPQGSLVTIFVGRLR